MGKTIKYKASEAEIELLEVGYHRRSSGTVTMNGRRVANFSYGQSEDTEACLRDGDVYVSWNANEPGYTKTIEFDALQGSVGFWSTESVSWLSWPELKAVADRAEELGFNA
jgi:hypothetical protein